MKKQILLVCISLMITLLVSCVYIKNSGNTKYSVTIQVNGIGEVTPAPGTYKFNDIEPFSISAKTNNYWRFDGWSGDIETDEATISVNTDSNKKVVANFTQIKYKLTVSTIGDGVVNTGNIGIGNNEYIPGSIVPLKASSFTKWSGDIDSSSQYTIVTMDSDKSVVANFKPAGIISDPQLEVIIRKEIDKPIGDLFELDLEKITVIDAKNSNITNLSGIENCKYLQRVDLSNNRIEDISPLNQLINLSDINLNNNLISDISALSSLTNLRTLRGDLNLIIDISPLTNLKQLELLQMAGNKIVDVEALETMTNLRVIDLQANQINDISIIGNLTNVEYIDLQTNRISDIVAFTKLTNLKYLNLERNQITNISPLISNTGLSQGDILAIGRNPLNSESINIYIPEIKNRGVYVGMSD